MTKTRLNIPEASLTQKENSIAEVYRAVYLRFLKIYTQHKKPEWDSYTGIGSNALKSGVSSIRSLFGANPENTSKHRPKSITTGNDRLTNEIINATTYHDYINLIDILNDEAKKAQAISNQRSWRTSFYFAIITLIQENVQLQFPQEYAQELAALRHELTEAKVKYADRFSSCMLIQKDCEHIENILRKLVLLGDRDVFAEAFMPGRNLFNYLSYMSADMVIEDDTNLTQQFALEEGHSIQRTPFVNPNIPMQLQQFFPRMLLMSDELGNLKTDNMGDFVKFALQDRAMMNTNNPLSQKFFPKAVSPATQPADIEDLMRAETPPRKVATRDESSELPNDNNAPYAAPHQDEDESPLEISLEDSSASNEPIPLVSTTPVDVEEQQEEPTHEEPLRSSPSL